MEKSRFFNSSGGDRKYLAEDFADYFASILSNGVFLHETNALKVAPYSGLTISIAAGRAYINGYAYQNTAALNKTLATASSNRIDRIVVRLDMTTRNILIVVKQGSPATSPTAPTLTRTADVYELGIADIYLAAGTVSITAAMITDLREDKTYCGGVTMTVDRDEILGDITNTITNFTEATNRTNIATAEKTNTILGKIKKWFTDLKALAFKDKIAAGDITAGAITNDDISASAAIAVSKLSGLGSLATKSSIADADVASNAAIAQSKINGLGAAASKAVDTTPTSGSANLVTSGGVYTALAAKSGYETKTVLYNGTTTLTTNGSTLALTATPAAGDIIEMHYIVNADATSYMTYVRRFVLTSSFCIVEITGGQTKNSGFTAVNYYFTWSGTTLTMVNRYYLLNFANNGGSLLENNGGIRISKIYKITQQ